jgi:hypothetical protein
MTTRGSDIFAFTPTYGSRRFLHDTVVEMRAKAGLWFDWGVWGGALSAEALSDAEALLNHPQKLGIQLLETWAENRGQHHATAAALAIARERGYDWLLRIDDDVLPRTEKWLKKIMERTAEMKKLSNDTRDHLVVAPRMCRLNNPLQPIGDMDLGQGYKVDVMGTLGGMVRLHPVSLLDEYEPPIFSPKGRRDPESITQYLEEHGGYQVRFPDIRIVHDTNKIEAEDDSYQRVCRTMGYYWPYLGSEAA